VAPAELSKGCLAAVKSAKLHHTSYTQFTQNNKTLKQHGTTPLIKAEKKQTKNFHANHPFE